MVASSVQSFGAGVAVAQSLYGVANEGIKQWQGLRAWCPMMLDSSSTTPPEARNVKLIAAGRNS